MCYRVVFLPLKLRPPRIDKRDIILRLQKCQGPLCSRDILRAGIFRFSLHKIHKTDGKKKFISHSCGQNFLVLKFKTDKFSDKCKFTYYFFQFLN